MDLGLRGDDWFITPHEFYAARMRHHQNLRRMFGAAEAEPARNVGAIHFELNRAHAIFAERRKRLNG